MASCRISSPVVMAPPSAPWTKRRCRTRLPGAPSQTDQSVGSGRPILAPNEHAVASNAQQFPSATASPTRAECSSRVDRLAFPSQAPAGEATTHLFGSRRPNGYQAQARSGRKGIVADDESNDEGRRGGSRTQEGPTLDAEGGPIGLDPFERHVSGRRSKVGGRTEVEVQGAANVALGVDGGPTPEKVPGSLRNPGRHADSGRGIRRGGRGAPCGRKQHREGECRSREGPDHSGQRPQRPPRRSSR